MLTELKAHQFNAWTRGNLPFSPEGLVFYAPLGQADMQGNPIISYDQYLHSCTVTGAIWGVRGRSFDKTDDKIACGTAILPLISTEATIVMWVKTSEIIPGAAHSYLIDSIASSKGIGLYITDTTGTLRLVTGDGTQASADLGTLSWGVGEEHCIAVDYDGSYSRGYIDGVYLGVSSTVRSSITNGGQNININIGTTNNFYGTIGDVLIYNRSLTPSEIQHDYLATKWRYI
jgi:hypothetical protein